MSKRQIRLSTRRQIASKTSESSGKKVNIAMKSGEVFFVEITAVNTTTLNVRNMMQKTQSLDIDQIAEIILDLEV